MNPIHRPCFLFWRLLLPVLLLTAPAWAFAVTFEDAAGRSVTISEPPRRVVSLVPSVSEIIVELGAAEVLKGLTHHDAELVPATGAVIVGGFVTPSARRVAALNPDLIFLSDIQRPLQDKLSLPEDRFVYMRTGGLEESLEDIRLLGKVLGKEQAAAATIASIKDDLALVAEKIQTIPEQDRRRVIRIMGRQTVMTPGADSFQNELIRAAGGITHDIKQTGEVIDVSLRQWRQFDPQFIYGCGRERDLAEQYFDQPGWKDVAAVENHQIRFYPCDLTCRAASRTGRFVSWLAADIYTAAFSRPDLLARPERVLDSRPVALAGKESSGRASDGPGWIDDCRIDRSRIYDFINQTLIIELNSPMTILSSLDGWRSGVTTVGNHYYPPPCWPISHTMGLTAFRSHVYKVLDKDPRQTALLFTGADMDNLAVAPAAHRDLKVWALVTAGVAGNAMRASRDTGFYYEPGTINIILLSNRRLSPRAMTRAMISATEAKTAALLDLDIRSSYGDGRYRATGTGTDNIIVVQGQGPEANKSGGHTKLGELIARAVHDGVSQAIWRQNRLTPERHLFQRLRERGLTIGNLTSRSGCGCPGQEGETAAALEKILLDPEYAGFIELALSLSDDYEKGLLSDLSPFQDLAERVCRDISGDTSRYEAGSGGDCLRELLDEENMPEVVQIAFNALLSGLAAAGEEEAP